MANFWDSLGNTLGNITGVNQANQAAEQNKAGNANAAASGQTLGNIAGTTAGQFAEGSGKAGAALGEQMGRTAATGASRNALQSARTGGLNAGQAAQLGGQAGGQAFQQGQAQGQGMGMQAYGQGASNQLGAAQSQGTLGLGQQTAGTESSKQGNAATGGLLNAVGGLFGLKDGGIVDSPTAAVVGEAGPEAVVPLSDPERIKAILGKLKGTPAAAPIAEAVEPPNEVAKEQEKVPDKKAEKPRDDSLSVILQLARRVIELEDGKK